MKEWRGPGAGASWRCTHLCPGLAVSTHIHPGFGLAPSHSSGLCFSSGASDVSAPPPRPQQPQPQPQPRKPTYGCGPTSPWRWPPLRGSKGRTGEGVARVSYLEGGEVGVAHDPVDSLEVRQVPLRHVHQLGGVYLVGEVCRAVLQRGRVFILVAVFLGMGTKASLGPAQGHGLQAARLATSSPHSHPHPPPVLCGRPRGQTSSSPLPPAPLVLHSPPSPSPCAA